ncbi:AzlC family ABC transporter permease [Acinetobacter radioresistens]|jgi:4-azaleucine resistance transporter AzlC|uniref:AzlC protein n=2 Tax=Acinetobacter radioresistens TaxID=40216 RepID=A0ABP2GKK4_ACIRA|nr:MULTISPECIES: AzlC family ABC transporter permease [Acinetobacter]EET81710.1 AzlC protein [Acinetobacter radioresistens SK82]EEY87591.1 AzlC protein [Acinetobacter radioresistens SH164]ENV87916.1 azaleucine resistance protein AzlC [Acinetobacter radioresistens NIPH 2130]EXB86253.1 azlC family protein [Acinetobacter sp. 272263]EXE60708.1 azlC family protein [Acinetobacter sp. 1239920]
MCNEERNKLIKTITLISVATGIVGISLGSIAASFHIPLWIPLALSIFVLAGAAEFTFIGLIASGANPIFAALTGILINLRHFPFGLSVATFIEKNTYQFFACHIMNDESVMFGLSQKNTHSKKWVYWMCGLGISILWPLGVFIGYLLSKNIPDIYIFGIDAAFPAILFALILPMLKNKTTRNRVFLGTSLSLASIPLLPTGLPVLVSMFGLIIGRKTK